MTDRLLAALSDVATEAHTRIQQTYSDLNPVVGVNRGMRGSGIPADVMTIDCLATGKRIILILHDGEPDIISYQFAYKAKDPSDDFEKIDFNALDADTLFNWMKDYFRAVK